jgi:hypothetical protein
VIVGQWRREEVARIEREPGDLRHLDLVNEHLLEQVEKDPEDSEGQWSLKLRDDDLARPCLTGQPRHRCGQGNHLPDSRAPPRSSHRNRSVGAAPCSLRLDPRHRGLGGDPRCPLKARRPASRGRPPRRLGRRDPPCRRHSEEVRWGLPPGRSRAGL